jgi:hypothetical protein
VNNAAGRQGIDSALDVAIALSCAVFIAVLLLSGYFERDLLTLHLFQSLIYVAVAFLSFKRNKFGYGMGISIASEWNAYNLFASGFIAAGFRQMTMLLQSGRISKPVHLLGAIGGIDHFALIACLLWAYARLPAKRFRDAWILLTSAIVVTVYFLAIIAMLWPQFIPRLRRHIGV